MQLKKAYFQHGKLAFSDRIDGNQPSLDTWLYEQNTVSLQNTLTIF